MISRVDIHPDSDFAEMLFSAKHTVIQILITLIVIVIAQHNAHAMVQDTAATATDAAAKSKTEKPVTEKPVTEKPVTEKPATEKQASATDSKKDDQSASARKAEFAKKSQTSEAWDYSPYSVNVWIAYDQFPEFSPFLHQKIAEQVPSLAAIDDHCGWTVSVQMAPEIFRYSIINDLDDFAFDETELELDELVDGDKLMLVGISRMPGGLRVSTREYDCRLKQYSSTVSRDVISYEQLPELIYATVRQAFVPLARVLTVEGKSASALLRAGGLLFCVGESNDQLVRNVGSPAWIPEQSICTPVQRRSVRSKGKTVLLTTRVDWTFAVVKELSNIEKEPVLQCALYSAMRVPLGGKRGSRSERILRLCKPIHKTTTLSLTDRSIPPKPARSYTIYRVIPGDKDSSEEIGRTDWQGRFVVDVGDDPLVLLYVRSGSRTLARLPIVPGQEEGLTAAMFSDAVRLRAEGIVRGMQSNLLNLIAQRQSLSVQIRVALENKEVQQAESLMSDFRLLQTGDQFLSRLEAQASSLQGKDAREQSKIDRMFNELRTLVSKHLTSAMNVSLTRDIEHVSAGNDLEDLDGPDQLEQLKKLEENEAE